MAPAPLWRRGEARARPVGGEPTLRAAEYSDTKPELSGSGTDLRV